MAHRYAPLPNSSSGTNNVSQHDRETEMEAAFDYSDDEDNDDIHNTSESQPLNRRAAAAVSVPSAPSPPQHSPAGPGVYNFENVDYDYPPPGSPPPPSATALPNDIGNSNGMVPNFSSTSASSHTQGPHRTWLRRAAGAVLPTSVLSRIGLAQQRPAGPIGGGINNDGVFANVMAKPTAPVRHQDGDEFVSPEDAQREAPPSYASAQADAVPPYWENTVHAPFSSDTIGEMIIDNLPTGTLFAFCWNMLVSIAFQFVGFVLTYVLHTSHAGRLGSKAGFGVTLIQYGFALRSKLEESGRNGGTAEWGWGGSEANSTDHWHHHHHHGAEDGASMGNVTWNTPLSNITESQASVLIADATTEWLSFFLMTIGWFVLLTSFLGFWRVKRWERSVITSRNNNSSSTSPETTTSARRSNPLVFGSNLESHFGLRGISRLELLRSGFGLDRNRQRSDGEDAELVRAEDGGVDEHEAGTGTGERDPMIRSTTAPSVLISPNMDPERARALVMQLENEVRLQRDLQQAGLI